MKVGLPTMAALIACCCAVLVGLFMSAVLSTLLRPIVNRFAAALMSLTRVRPCPVKSVSPAVPAPVKYGSLFAADVSPAIAVSSVSSGWFPGAVRTVTGQASFGS